MALVWCDGFDYYTSDAHVNARKCFISPSFVTYQQSPRASGNGYSISMGNDRTYLSPNVWNGVTTVIFGCGLFMPSIPVANDRIWYIINTANNQLCDIGVKSTGKLYATRANTQLGSDSALTLAANTWYYIEAKIVIGTGTSGSIIVNVNETETLNIPSVNTAFDSGFAASRLQILANGTMRFDDLYMADTTGSYNNDFLGDVKIVSSIPDANGNTNNFTPTAGQNYEAVDDVPTSTSDYVYSSTAGNIDDYSFLPVQETGNIYGVQVSANMQVIGGHARDIRFRSDSNSNQTETASQTIGAGPTPFYQTGIFERNPDGAAAWTDTTVNDAKFGVKLQT